MAIFSKQAPDGTVRRHAWDPELKKERRGVLAMVGKALALVLLFMLTLFPLYFGSYFRQEQNAYRLTIRVLDLDSQYAAVVPGAPAAILGPAVLQAIQQNIQAKPGYHLGWQIADSAELSTLQLTSTGPYSQGRNASQYAEHLVLNQDVFGVILINPNATLLATEAVQQGSTAYDPRGAVTFYYEEARNFFSENQYVSLLSTEIIESASAQAASQFTGNFLSTAATGGTLTAALGVLNNPFGYSTYNLRPFDQLAAEAPTTAGAIYLIILTFFISPSWKQAYAPLRPKLKATSDIALRLLVPFLAYVWISLMYSLVTLAYGVSFNRKYGRVGFFIYWCLNIVTMSGLGFIMESALSLFGLLFFAFFLAFWVIWNVSVAFLDLSDMDRFYLYGFAFPVWNSVDGTKSIIFGTKNHLVQNFAVNLAWMFGGAFLLAMICVWQRASGRDQFSAKDPKLVEMKHGEEKERELQVRAEERESLRHRLVNGDADALKEFHV